MNFLLEKGKTPEGLANALGRTERSVYYWFSGGREPRFTIREIQLLCRYLDCEVHDLPQNFGPSREEEPMDN